MTALLQGLSTTTQVFFSSLPCSFYSVQTKNVKKYKYKDGGGGRARAAGAVVRAPGRGPELRSFIDQVPTLRRRRCRRYSAGGEVAS